LRLINSKIWKLSFISTALVGSWVFVPESRAQQYVSTEGYVEFVSTAPLLEFKGVSNDLHGLIDLGENLVDFFVDLNTLETGIRRRDRDMRNSYLETNRYPFAEFTGQIVSGIEQLRRRNVPVEVTASGSFTMRQISHDITVEGTMSETEGGGLLLEASWVIRLKDYNIDRPSVLFYELADEQTINIRINLSERN